MQISKFSNAIYCTAALNPWTIIAKKMYSNYGIKPRHFLFWPENITNKINKNLSEEFPDCSFQTIYEAIKGIGFPKVKRINTFDRNIAKQTAEIELIAIKMMDRFDPNHSDFSFTFRQWFFRDLLITWLDIIDEYNIDIVFSPSIPHRGYDFALYAACKLRKVKFITFQWVTIGSLSIIKEDILTPLNVPLVDFDGNLDDLFVKRITNVRSDFKSGQLEIFKTYQKQNNLIFGTLIKLKYLYKRFISFKFSTAIVKSLSFIYVSVMNLFRGVFSYNVQRNKMPYNSNFTGLSILKLSILRRFKLYRLKKYYNNLVSNDISKKYILFPLHQQPEETSSPLGGVFVDQTLVIQMLDKVLPPEFDIIIKEHKTQFYHFAENPEAGRTKYFYDRILNISNRVKFVSIDSSTYSLIDNSCGVITITGTPGWESVLRGKYSIVFGFPWYQQMPGVFSVQNINELKEAIFYIINNKFEINDNEIFQFHYSIQQSAINGYICYPYKQFLNISDINSTENINNGIIKYLNL
jgi:hypothetical protein